MVNRRGSWFTDARDRRIVPRMASPVRTTHISRTPGLHLAKACFALVRTGSYDGAAAFAAHAFADTPSVARFLVILQRALTLESAERIALSKRVEQLETRYAEHANG